MCFDDSPLVKAMRYGRVLVIDEFDKAPTEAWAEFGGWGEAGRAREGTASDARKAERRRRLERKRSVVPRIRVLADGTISCMWRQTPGLHHISSVHQVFSHIFRVFFFFFFPCCSCNVLGWVCHVK